MATQTYDWNLLRDQINALKQLKKDLDVNNEGLVVYLREYFGNPEAVVHDVTPDNIEYIILFLLTKKKIAEGWKIKNEAKLCQLFV